MEKSKIKEFAKKNGYDDVLPLGKWKEYDAYEPVSNGPSTSYVGPPLMVLVKGEEIRMSTVEEAFQQLDDTENEEIETAKTFKDILGKDV